MSICTSNRVYLKLPFDESDAAEMERLMEDLGDEYFGSEDGREWRLRKSHLILTVVIQPLEQDQAECQADLAALGVAPTEIFDVVTVKGLKESAEFCRQVAERIAANLEGLIQLSIHTR
ncbi:hypothetical protein Pan241w_06350 [Gimesia alba]|uniref:Uncharacterized protein n=1 Tax=Gimesia alba TaxID=2527973 RepID=A0A517R9N5_9PLAN|nr:hypothetical protein [Gimesia alba]QDT40578.1 hypothetical protein Pan241w_06350 [Gimesia alba]